MKKIWITLICIVLFGMAACKGKDVEKLWNQKEQEEGTANDSVNNETLDGAAYLEEEIDITPLKQEFTSTYRRTFGFISNDGALEALEYEEDEVTRDTKISIWSLGEDKNWIYEGKSWSLQGPRTISHIKYGKDGELYGLSSELLEIDGKYYDSPAACQLYHLLKDGTSAEVKLDNLNMVAKTALQDNLGDNEEEWDDPSSSSITFHQVLEDKTVLIGYVNSRRDNINRLYDMESGEKIQSFNSMYELSGENVAITKDVIIFADHPLKDVLVLNFMKIKDGTIVKTITYPNEGMGTGMPMIASEDGEEIYIYTDKGLFMVNGDSDKVKRLAESNKIKPEDGDYCSNFFKGVRNDFFVYYYEGIDESDPQVQPIYHMLRYY